MGYTLKVQEHLKAEYNIDVIFTNITCKLDEKVSKCSCEKAVCY